MQHRCEDADHCVGAGELIVVRGAEPARAAVDAMVVHHAGRCLGNWVGRQVVCLRAGGIAPDMAADDPRIDLGECVTR